MKLLLYFVALVTCLSATKGFCGAWQPKPNELQIIAGKYQDSENNQSDGEIFIEYGLTSTLAISGNSTIIKNKDLNNTDTGYINNYGIKYGVFENNDWVSAVKLTYINAQFSQTADIVNGYSTSILVGHNFTDKIWGNFEAGNRNIDGDDNAFWDMAVGYKINNNSQFIIKNFGDQISKNQTRNIMQLSYVYSLNRVGLELAYRKTVSAPVNWDGQGVLTSVWFKY